jgi:hypothetical protein
MARAGHFHVLVGLCGMYMPDENHVYRTRKEAEDGARSLARQFRDDGDTVTGSVRDGFYRVGDDYCIEITDCDEQDCLRDLDD